VAASGIRATQKRRRREQRRDAAEEVCWRILILMGIGALEDVPMRLRDLVAEPMQKWADLNPKVGS
jgi:hypothetical protein